MSEQSSRPPSGGHQPPPPSMTDAADVGHHRVGPRPLERAPVDPALAAEFGRPEGISGAFTPNPPVASGTGHSPASSVTPPASLDGLSPEVLSEAFGRPGGGSGPSLQRPPGTTPFSADTASDPAFWGADGEHDPWRDPGTGAVLGPPAGEPVRQLLGTDEPPPRPGPLLSVPELLFGRRVKPMALASLAGVALLIGAAGGLAGWGIAQIGNPLTSSVTLSQVEPGVQRAPGSIAEVVKRVQRAVVQIEVHTGQTGGLGSGVVIDGAGYVLTNNHVVSAAAKDTAATLQVVFADGTKVSAKIVGRDPRTDLAVVKVAVANPTVAQLGRSSSLAVGDQVIAIGSPLGLASSVTSGIVSALDRPFQAAGEGGDPPSTYDAIQTDAAINHGNSGGALLDSTGALVGINSAIASPQDTGSIGIGFAIPIDFARRIAEGLIRDGQVHHADIGVNAKAVSSASTDGAQVQNVKQGGAGERAGIVEGDVIVKLGDRPIRNADELAVAVIEHGIGETVSVQVVREGRQMALQVTTQSD